MNQLSAETDSDSDDTFTIEGLSLHNDSDINSVQTDDDCHKKEGHCTLTVNDKTLKIKVSTEAKCNVISLDTYKVMRHTEKLLLEEL